jgi:hypothetical protein
VRPERLQIHAAGPGPAAQAREIREQITGHLDEALPPDADDQEIAAALILRVRVGWFTRTEVIPLSDGFYLIGPSQGHCPR